MAENSHKKGHTTEQTRRSLDVPQPCTRPGWRLPFQAGPWRAHPSCPSCSVARPHQPLGCSNWWTQLHRPPWGRDSSRIVLAWMWALLILTQAVGPWSSLASACPQGGPSVPLLVPHWNQFCWGNVQCCVVQSLFIHPPNCCSYTGQLS